MMNNNFAKLSYYSYYMMMFFLPLSLILENIFLGLFFLATIFSGKNKVTSNVFYYLIIFFVYTVLNGFLKGYFVVENKNYFRLLPLLFVPVCIYNLKSRVIIKGILFLLLGIIVIQLNAIYGIIDYYYFTEGKKYALKNYSKVNEILNYERPYLGFFSAISIIFYFYFYQRNKKKHLNVLLSIFSLFIITIISARLAFIIVFLGSLAVVSMKINKKKIFKAILFLTISFTFLTKMNNSLQERFKLISKDARLITWQGAKNIYLTNSKYFFGSGSQQQTRSYLKLHYKNYKNYSSEAERNRFIRLNYNTHNQYINELLRNGLIGLILLIFPQLILFFQSLKTKTITSLLMLISIVCFMLVENILDRQVGIYLYVLLLSLTNFFLKVKKSK